MGILIAGIVIIVLIIVIDIAFKVHNHNIDKSNDSSTSDSIEKTTKQENLTICQDKEKPKTYTELRKEAIDNDAELMAFYGKNKFHDFISIDEIRQSMKKHNGIVDYLKSFLDERGLKYTFISNTNTESLVRIEDSLYIFVIMYSYPLYQQGDRLYPISEIDKNATTPSTCVFELTHNDFFTPREFNSGKCHAFYSPYLSFSRYNDLRNCALKRASSIMDINIINSINDEWEGLPASCVVFELKNGSSYEYALAITESVEDSVSFGQRKIQEIPEYEKNKAIKIKKMEIDKGNLDDMLTYDLSCPDSFVKALYDVKKQIQSKTIKAEGDGIFEKLLSQIVYYIVPIFIQDKSRDNIKDMKNNMFSIINHEYLSKYESYPYVNGHKKWKNEYLLYKLCKKLYGRQVIYQYRPQYLKTDKGQLSYDIYLSQYRIAIEYQGEQHFRPVGYFGGEDAFKDLKRRDILKKELSKKEGIPLIEIRYDETITSELIDSKVKEYIK